VVADYITIKTRIALARIMREHPSIDFGVSTPEVKAADDDLTRECLRWIAGQNTTEDVRAAFKRWERELVAANQTTAQMFG
jgi:hypothetical protein